MWSTVPANFSGSYPEYQVCCWSSYEACCKKRNKENENKIESTNSTENICCMYSFEVSRRGAFNEYPQHMFSWRYMKTSILFGWKQCLIWRYGSPLENRQKHFNLVCSLFTEYLFTLNDEGLDQTASIHQGPFVQSVVSLTSSLRVILLTVLADSIYNILIFFAEKMWRKSYSHFFSKKYQNICVSLDVNFNESLTNDIVSFEQLGPAALGINFCIN